MTGPELLAWLAEAFPQALEFGFELHELGPAGATLRLPTRPDHLRPGGTVSGPTLMTLADTAAYVSLLARLGPSAGGGGVTSSLEIQFLRRPSPGVVLARCHLLKVGRRLAVARVDLESGGALVAHATVSYALPEPPGAG